MPEPDAPAPTRLNVGDLIAALRGEVLRRRTGAADAGSAPQVPLDWEGPIYLLAQADRRARVGTALPEMSRFRGIKRPFARFVARCVLALSRFLTAEQREFNLAALDALRQFGDRVQQLERVQNETVRRLEAELAELRASRRADAAEVRVRKAS
ncbi:MAG TPA: hypothetical protein VJ739_16730 [Gemmataceae bacterium]|nr:hypothetical protein [Gemmataceae bacterium]